MRYSILVRAVLVKLGYGIQKFLAKETDHVSIEACVSAVKFKMINHLSSPKRLEFPEHVIVKSKARLHLNVFIQDIQAFIRRRRGKYTVSAALLLSNL